MTSATTLTVLKNAMAKVTFPLTVLSSLRIPKKSPQERKKEGDLSFCAVAIDSKAQPCKISVEVGGGTRQQRAFFTTAKPKRDHCPPPVSPTHTMGSAHHSRCTLKPAELCDDEVKDMKSVSPPRPRRVLDYVPPAMTFRSTV